MNIIKPYFKLVLMLVLSLSSFAVSKTLSYVLNEQEYEDSTRNDDTVSFLNGGSPGTKRTPIYNINKKAITGNITISGIDTKHIKAQSGFIYSLISETEIIKMENKTGWVESEWFYVFDSHGLTIIYLFNKRQNIKIYNLGINRYTAVGYLETDIAK